MEYVGRIIRRETDEGYNKTKKDQRCEEMFINAEVTEGTWTAR
jgi:hypothetical protein